MEVGLAASQQLPFGATVHALHVPLPDVPFRHIRLYPEGVVQTLAVTVPPTMSAAVVPPAHPHMLDGPDAHFVPFLQWLDE